MSNTNDFVPFCNSNTGTNLPTQSAYLVNPDLPIGNQPGIASSSLNNKALRQGTTIAAVIAQYVVNEAAIDMLDDQNSSDHAVPAALLGGLTSVFKYLSPVFTAHLAGSGTHYLTYKVQCASASATTGATYSDGTSTFTVANTISGSTEIWLTGSSTNPVSSGTLTLISGTGDATITYYAVRAPLYLRVKMVGAGGGGAGSGTASAGSGGTGGNTTFGTSLLTCNGGGFGEPQNPGGLGGSATIGSGATGFAIRGGSGSQPGTTGGAVTSSGNYAGGPGGASALGGNGAGYLEGTSYMNGATNSGGGGGGAGSSVTAGTQCGSGGGAGGFIDACIENPVGSYAWAVGASGIAGAAGTSGLPGGSGGSGGILVEEHYQ